MTTKLLAQCSWNSKGIARLLPREECVTITTATGCHQQLADKQM